jgi:hypothetical protein
VEGESLMAARVRIENVREARFDARALVAEWKRSPIGRAVRQALAILDGLNFKTDKRLPLFLGLNDACRLPVNVEQVIRKAMSSLQREAADGNATPGRHLGFVAVLSEPARLGKQTVNRLSRFIFGCFGHTLREKEL